MSMPSGWESFIKSRPLEGKICLVAGASRGVGRGIALALGDAGATVLVTGRTPAKTTHPDGMVGTVEETAQLVRERGASCEAFICDHTDVDQLESLREAVETGYGKLDLLVNNVWAGYEHNATASFMAPFHEQDPHHWERMFGGGVRPALFTSRVLVPLLIANKGGLIVNTLAWDRGRYLGNVFYDTAKGAIARMAYALSRDLRGHNIEALAVAPGFTRTERVMAHHAKEPFELEGTESAEYVGRGIAHLLADSKRERFNGEVVKSGELAAEYGFSDTDGRQIPPFEIPEQ